MMTPLATERRLRRYWRVVRRGLPSPGRYARYFCGLAPALGLIWGATAAYLLVMPRSFTSNFSLILPGSGSGSMMNVESIGQAQGTTSSAFASPSLSPTENYKQLLSSDVILRAAALLAQENPDRFPTPAIKLVDQTNFINVAVTGRSPQSARHRAEALRNAFLTELDRLRNDEASKRETSDLRRLDGLSVKEQAAQRRLISFQASHGLATLEQFNARIAAVDGLRDKERDLRLQASVQRGTAERLATSLSAGPGKANLMMRLRGDPVFQELLQHFSASNAEAEQKAATLGPQHGGLAQTEAERGGLQAALLRRGRELTGWSDARLMHAADFQLADGRSNLMQAMSISDAQGSGTQQALGQLRGDLSRAQSQTSTWIAQASQLADLQRDHRIAEAVFSSALARLDTNKQDPFASYPLVQTLAAPSLPGRPSQPSATIALAAAILATLFTLIAFGMAWLRQPILNRILPNG